ncbi:MAG: alcohol dehydrogenase catalytic domain-containing protein [Candidatus Sumerlaeaceae bacterium]
MTTYSAATLLAPNRTEITAQPHLPLEAGEVLLKIEYAGICGTDLSLYRGHYPVPLPLVLGHEFSARVVECGANVDTHWLNKRVVCEINNSCVAYGYTDLCTACKRGMPTHCLRRTVTGIINHPGAFAEYLRAPAGNLHELPDDIPSDIAVFVEPLAAAIRTFELTPLSPGDTVVVLGCGRLGRLVTLVAHKLGARVIAVTRSTQSLEYVRNHADLLVRFSPELSDEFFMQVEHVATPGELREFILAHTAGLGADVVVEATGMNENFNLALQLVRPLGHVSLKSTSGVPVRELNTTEAIVNEVQIHTSRCGPFDKAIAFLQQHKKPDQSWISATYPLAEITMALGAATHEPKVLLEIGRDNL